VTVKFALRIAYTWPLPAATRPQAPSRRSLPTQCLQATCGGLLNFKQKCQGANIVLNACFSSAPALWTTSSHRTLTLRIFVLWF
jgi:hypothetical protein